MLEIETITAWMHQNQFLAGGIGTVAFGSAMYVARRVPQVLLGTLSRSLTTTLTITTRFRQYDEVALLLGRHSLPFMMRNYAPHKNSTNGRLYTSRRKQSGPSNLAPGYGGGWGLYKGRLLTFYRRMMEGKGDEINEEIEVRFLSRNKDLVETFLREAETLQDADRVSVNVSDGTYFSSGLKKPKRPLSSVFVASQTKNRLVQAIDQFQASEDAYGERGIPYKFCAVLHGPPGTGKTSLVHAIASHFGLAINYVTSLTYIDSLVSECNENELLVIEDIDALAADLKREAEKKDDDTRGEGPLVLIPSNALHKLLNAVDGFCTPHGLKVLITTNHPDKLDPALLRPGRTDLMLEIGPIAGDDLKAMFEAFYGPGSSLILDGLTIPPHTGSRLQQIFTSHTASEARDILASAVSGTLHECNEKEAA